MKKTLPLLALALVSLTGCVNINNAAPEESASSSPSASPSSADTSSTTAAPASSSKAPESPSSSPSETPVHAVPEKTQNASKTSFSGTTAKGNDISFFMLPAFDQDTMNGMMRSTGLSGSWASLCSSAATQKQLTETAVNTVSSSGSVHTWMSFKYAAPYLDVMTESQSQLLEQKLVDGPAEGTNLTCIPVITQQVSASLQGYPSATVGQYVGSQNLVNTVEIY